MKKCAAWAAASAVLTLAVCAAVWTARAGGPAEARPLPFAAAVKYTVYVGLSDPVTGQPAIPPAQAKALLNAVCFRHVSGFTVSEAQGHWTDAAGGPVYEDTLVYVFLDPEPAAVRALLEDLRAAMGQCEVLAERMQCDTLFYSGG